jgi:Ca-activated chloride channel family protein
MLESFSDPVSLLWLPLGLLALLAAWRWSLVDRPRGLRLASFFCRLLAVLLLGAGLAQPQRDNTSDKAHVAFLLDVSASVDPDAASRAVDEIDQAIERLGKAGGGATHSLHAVAATLRQGTPASLRQWLRDWRSGADDAEFRSASALAGGLLAARLGFPAGSAVRVVLFTDAVPTGGPAAAALEQLQAEGVDVRVRRLESLRDPEAAVTAWRASSETAFEGEVVRFEARVTANQPMTARVRLTHQGVAFAEKEAVLSAPAGGGEAVADVVFDAPMTTTGPSVWGVEIVPERDRFSVNNQASAVVRVSGRPRLLVLHDPPLAMSAFAEALRTQQMDIDVRTQRGLPSSLTELAAFDAVVLSNIPASALPAAQLRTLRHFVSDLGGGLVMLGSENSFGLGGYHRTPVEEVLPLVSRFEKEKEKPAMALVLVIDKSGSMSGQPIALARQAAKMAVELLSGRDQAAVIGFDTEPQVICELTSAADMGSIQAAIDSLEAGGGTDLYPGMVAAGEMLRRSDAKIKHMIVLSDGQTPDKDFHTLTHQLVDEAVTVSTIALGDDAARELLAGIAETGRGRYYETVDPTTVPQIFTRETMQAGRNAIQEDLFLPVPNSEHALLEGFPALDALPAILGYVMAQARPTAEILLTLENGDPLLAFSRFGLGAGLAYTSDLTEAWGPEWLASETFGAFWARILRGVARRQEAPDLNVRALDVKNGIWSATLEHQDRLGQLRQPARWEAVLASATTGALLPVTVNETGLGRFRLDARLPQEAAGSMATWTLRLHETAQGRLVTRHHQPAYPAEYRLNRQPDPALAALPEPDLAQLVAGLPTVTTPQPLRPALWLAALALLLLSVLLRRV